MAALRVRPAPPFTAVASPAYRAAVRQHMRPARYQRFNVVDPSRGLFANPAPSTPKMPLGNPQRDREVHDGYSPVFSPRDAVAQHSFHAVVGPVSALACFVRFLAGLLVGTLFLAQSFSDLWIGTVGVVVFAGAGFAFTSQAQPGAAVKICCGFCQPAFGALLHTQLYARAVAR